MEEDREWLRPGGAGLPTSSELANTFTRGERRHYNGFVGEARTNERHAERGSVLIIAMIALVALAGLGGFTALSVQSGVSAQSASRFESVALYSAESGVASAMEFLRANIDPTRNWSQYVSANNATPQKPLGIPGNLVLPGQTGSLFTNTLGPNRVYPGWFAVTILNNESDPGFANDPTSGQIADTDARLRLRVVGYGPNNATVTIEVNITANNADALTGQPCSYEAQQGLGAQNAGVGCISGDIATGSTATFTGN